MSKPTNSAARNQMTEWERQCYDWGWEDAEERIIAIIDEFIENSDYPEVVSSLQWLQDVIQGENK